MLEQVLRYIKNWFLLPNGKHYGTFSVNGGNADLPFLKVGQYFRVIGSVFNDGLHKYGDGEVLVDETFTGYIWALAIPKPVIDLAEQIEAWCVKNEQAVTGPYQSESFGGYSYTLKDDAKVGLSWVSVFSDRLNLWRKL